MGCFDRIFLFRLNRRFYRYFFKGSDNTYIQVCLSRIFRVLIRSDRKMLVGLKYTRRYLIVVKSFFAFFISGFSFLDFMNVQAFFTCTRIDLRVVLYYHVEFAELRVIENINYKL